jgi:hypothetical protein
MSFDLPRSTKGLRFTGDVKALVEPDAPPPSALGKPRPRNAAPQFRAAMAIPMPPPSSVLVAQPLATPVPPPPSSPSPPASSKKDVYNVEMVPTPYVAPPYVAPPPRIVTPSAPPVMQAPRLVRKADAKEVSYDDEVATMAMDREGLDVMPGGGAFKMARPQTPPRSIAPIPNFRPAIVAPQIVPPKVERKRARGAPLALWLLASVVAGVLSYRLMPEALDRAGIVLEKR